MPRWQPLAILPNVDLVDPIEWGLIALAPVDDPRVDIYAESDPVFRTFLSRFTDPFRRPIRPTLLIVRAPISDKVRNIDAVMSFRDVVSVSTIAISRARQLIYSRSIGVIYSNAFAIYPWMVGRDGKHLIGSTLAHTSVDDVNAFHGQSSPEVVPTRLRSSDLDEPMLSELMRRWRHRYVARSHQWSELALFRALNMANNASQLPAGTGATQLDVGRMVALWVSAFEILVHPGVGRSNTRAVFALLKSVNWQNRNCRVRRYKAKEAAKTVIPSSILAAWIYGELYETRNQFLHGNPINRRSGLVPGLNVHLIQYAAPLFRMALTAFLDLRWKEPIPPLSEPKWLGRAVADRMHFFRNQDQCEEALLTTRKGIKRPRVTSRRSIMRRSAATP